MEEESLQYHRESPPGKIKIACSKPLKDEKDLSLAYTPGVAAPCKEIQKNPEKVWEYTNRGNTIAIISDGSAVLGLGEIGPEAGLPVMEGKAVLFKKFANIDAYPICIRIEDDNEKLRNFMTAISCLEPSFGGINLEDIKGPFCFELQEKLDKKMGIPVFHDDQDGTAVIIVAGLINALEIVGKEKGKVKIVISGAGAAGIACARMMVDFGFSKERIFMCDSKGLITTTREDINEYKKEFAQVGEVISLAEAVKDSDVFVGVSAPGILTEEMIKTMAQDPIVFAAANPIPEVMPDVAKKAGARIIATGRSDFPNQVNNVLGFPGIFRGALDARASTINKEMKIAAIKALSEIAKEPINEEILTQLRVAYPQEFKDGFGSKESPLNENYLIPKPFDPRVVPRVARFVAEAAMKSGVAKVKIKDLSEYEKQVTKEIAFGE
jgi:malate dehydrogenase (oxaloacetate-decarboxylating)(NADP+)